MNKTMNSVNEKTKIVGENRMQLLLFKLPNMSQKFGINVFKVREILKCPKLTRLAGSNPLVKGIASIRGVTIPVIDLSESIGFSKFEDITNAMVIVTEYNSSVQGFVVSSVENIENVSWENVEAPPITLGKKHSLTGVAKVKNELINIIDVEDILSRISPKFKKYAEDNFDTGLESIKSDTLHNKILIIDDSMVARKQLVRAISTMGFEVVQFNNGKEALEHVNSLKENNKIELKDHYDLIISDVEMPQMDGYTFVAEVRALKQDIKIILHTSLSGVFNQSLVNKVGANSFVSKFDPQVLGEEIKKMLNK